ncbi:MAG: glycine betaine ABC transporter substrate-binding protein [Desulfohalobiaceae bacterium]|nr:glycine betaine ABC transporter substrate-binding protein [Desulfohalobiaceae bacterium]
MHQKKQNIIRCILLALISLILWAAPAHAAKDTVKLSYVEWSSEIASTNLVKAVLERRMGYNCEIEAVDAEEMWASVAEGEADAMVGAWLPGTHKHYQEKYGDKVADLGPNLKGTQIGLVVPNVTLGRQTAGTGLRNKPYIKAESIGDLSKYADKFNHMIVGIDPEAGIMKKTKEAMKAYGLEDFDLIKGSERTMTHALDNAITKHEWIVVTGWIPHWMFARWNLKFLDDPKNVFGGKEHINTIVRKGLAEDMPEVARFLDNFRWSPEQMGQLMIWINEDDGQYPYEKALRYIRTHRDQVDSWVP